MAHRISLNLENRFSLNLDLLLDAYDKSSFSNGKIARFKELNKQDLDGEEKSSNPEKEELTSVPYYKLFRYSTLFDKILLLLAVISSLASSAAYSMLFLTFGKATGFIVTYVYTHEINGTNPEVLDQAAQTLRHEMHWFVMVCCILGAVVLTLTYFATVMLNYSALRQTFRIRELFFSQVLNQDISWYDQNQTGDFSSRIADDLKKIEEGLGEKLGVIIYYIGIFAASLIQALVQGWELALICMISIPISMLSMGVVSWISSKLSRQEMEAYGEAGSVAEEVLTSIRTVVAFGGQAKEEERYKTLLVSAKNNNIRKSLFNGINTAIMWFIGFASYSLAFWYGVNLIIKERSYPPDQVTYDAGNMIAIFYSVVIGQWYFGLAAPYFETISVARGAAAKIFSVIANRPIINLSKGKGKKPRRIQGKITFRNVFFNYPSRREVKILRGFNLTINAGETVALVGGSGCGKSTCIQLIQRFYDPDCGSVYIDNNKIKDLDLDWLRSYIGVVGQEPVLFEATIADNIKYGYLDATQEEIEVAAKRANAHGFIKTLPEGYSTMIGERGAQLSGGQKQRIAIARALVREPSILLLDEATSALDTKSEATVQAALDAASHDCTTVIVAHRLSTVRKADRIIVIQEGVVQEQGSHDDLMQAKGAYYKLVKAQVSTEEEVETTVAEAISSEDKEEFLRQKSMDGFEGDKRPSLLPTQSSQFFEEVEEPESKSSLLAIMKYSSPEWWIIVIGCLTSVVSGAGMPIYSVIFGNVIGILADEDVNVIRRESSKYSIVFLIMGVITSTAMLLQFYTFGIAGEKLTMRLRSLMFKAILKQEMGWFDKKNNGVGALCARLSGEAASVQGATGQRIGTILNSVTTIIGALAVAFYFEWRLTFVALCFTPIIVGSVYTEQKVLALETERYYQSLEGSTKIAVEAINGIRTVASLGCEHVFHDLYMKELYPYQEKAKRNTHIRGIVSGFARSILCFSYAAAMFYGAMLVKNENMEYRRVFIVCESIITTSWSLANALAFTPNFSKGLFAANRIFQLINRTPVIVDGSKNVNEKWETGNLRYKKVFFSYPNRPDVGVLKGLDLSILKGKMVALVGPSGCGKSTIVQLLERFYDPTSGSIRADERGIHKMNLHALRSHLGIVSQEPNLFSKTIGENIAYGDNSRTVTAKEIMSAATQANIHNFITSLPLGYDTKLGEKGTQLSGGQKQRIAIARALIRNPKVLLLDEATSALDAESEQVVQEALDNAKVGRTCISIAHRLKTIQDADVICVVNHGRVTEMGTHTELLNSKGLYYSLYSLQNYK